MEVYQNDTFEWKIDEFLKGESKTSPFFELGRQCCYLIFSGRSVFYPPDSREYVIYLIGFNTFLAVGGILKFCFVGGFWEEIYVKQKNFNRTYTDRLLLVHIRKEELMRNEAKLLKDGIVTLRLSFYEKLEQETQTTPDLVSNKALTMLDILSKDFSCFLESKEDADCVLMVGDAKFPVHRAILSARSEVFAAMFRHDSSETRNGVVDIQDVEAGVLCDFLRYVYSGKVHGLTADTAVPLYIVADKYALIELRDFCLDFLMNNLMIGNVCDAAVLAHSHGEEELEKKVVQFIQGKMEEVENSDEWKNLETNKPSLVIKLLRLTVKACNDKIKETSSK